MAREWLLEAAIGGRTFHFAQTTSVVGGKLYLAGLEPGAWSPGVNQSVALTVNANADLFAALATHDTGTAKLSLLDDDGTVEVFHQGVVVAPVLDYPDLPVSFTVTRDLYTVQRGVQVPDELARVDSDTWPLAAGTLGAAGAYYPVIFGYPGFQGEGVDPIPVVPAPLAQIGAGAGSSYLVVSEQARSTVATVRVRDLEAGGTETDEGCLSLVDLLGRSVRVCTLTNAGLPGTPSSGYLVGFNDVGGGGVRPMHQVIAYLLERWGRESLDWERFRESEVLLARYQVDTWVDSPVPDPWVLIESWLTHLPVNIRVGARGFYFTERRFRHDPGRVTRTLARGATRASAFTRSGPPENEVRVRYQPDSNSGWRAQVVVVGDLSNIRPGKNDLAGARYFSTEVSQMSFAKYGRRMGPSVDLDWTWDAGTAVAVAESLLDERALPAVIVSYDVLPSDARGLTEGDEVLLTDEAFGWVDQPGILEVPPLTSLERVRLTFRVPQR